MLKFAVCHRVTPTQPVDPAGHPQLVSLEYLTVPQPKQGSLWAAYCLCAVAGFCLLLPLVCLLSASQAHFLAQSLC